MEFRARAQEEWKKQIQQTSKPNVNKRLKFEMRAATAVMVELQGLLATLISRCFFNDNDYRVISET